jgi:integrase
MQKGYNRLSAKAVKAISEPGRHADGGGLYLVVGPGESRRWAFLYRFAGKRREMGLGPVRDVSLAAAREKAAELRETLRLGRDPLDAERIVTPPPATPPTTFADVAERYIAAHEPAWRSPVHARQWRQTLVQHAPEIWAMPVRDVETMHVLAALRPIWQTMPETAKRLRGRIARVLDAAKVEGLREGENPARWEGHLALTLPPPKRLTRGHHAAMPYGEVPGFVHDLRTRHGLAPLALEFLILTAARSGEVRGMTWAEVDMDAALWTVPGERMKGGRTHRVPLVPRALDLLAFVRPVRDDEGHVFPSPRGGVMSDMTLAAVLRRMGRDETVHGFRSSFRDWAGDHSTAPREVIEAALAHLVGDETERAYRRGDALEKRRDLMHCWARYVGAAPPR